MTPEAKAMVMQLMGQTYGQVKKQDEMIVGQSAQLNAKSGEMKQMFEQLAAMPTAPAPGQPAPQQAPAPQPAPVQQAPAPVAAPVTPEQAAVELQQAPAPAPVAEEQGMFDFSEPTGIDKLIELQKETNLLLKAIKLQLENSNVRPKRKTAVKKAKSSVA